MGKTRKTRLISSSASVRRQVAMSFLAGCVGRAKPTIVAPSRAVARALLREFVQQNTFGTGATFGFECTSLTAFASELARPSMAAQGLAFADRLALEAIAARVLRQAESEGWAGPLENVADLPGTARALASATSEMRCAGYDVRSLPDALPSPLKEADFPLRRLMLAMIEERQRCQLVDRAQQFQLASEAMKTTPALGAVLFFDVAFDDVAAAEFAGHWVEKSDEVLAVIPEHDPCFTVFDTLDPFNTPESNTPETSLSRCQSFLFDRKERPHTPVDSSLRLFSAPGEHRECVEIARRILEFAKQGVRFDQIGIVVHAASRYHAHLVEVFRRAEIPLTFSQGVRAPDPSGRALLALLDCAARDLSARAFSEYLSFGVIPQLNDGSPPAARPLFEVSEHTTDLYADLDLPIDPFAEMRVQARENPFALDRNLRLPRRWEAMLIDAAVIGSRQRWESRLRGLQHSLQLQRAGLEDPEGGAAQAIAQQEEELKNLRLFALPLLDELTALPELASWGEWLDALTALASRALSDPSRVVQVLASLEPLRSLGPVGLAEVRRVLASRLSDLRVRPHVAGGAVVVVDTADVRAHSFEVAFVPGLAEKLFPEPEYADPLIREVERARLPALASRQDRVLKQRLGLRLALGSASKTVVLSWPRLDVERARSRVPSFYVMEVLRAATGRLPNLETLERYARGAGKAALSWPAPPDASHAVDDVEYNLAACRTALRADRRVHKQATNTSSAKQDTSSTVSSAVSSDGALAYLMDDTPKNPAGVLKSCLPRSLRRRALRWDSDSWTRADGLLRAKQPLDAHRIGERAYSATGLQSFSACPLQFALKQVLRLRPREVPESVDALDPRDRGSLVHAIHFEVMRKIRDQELWPLDHPQKLSAAQAILAEVVERVSIAWAEELVPAIPRVWSDAIAQIETDGRRWLAELDPKWAPRHFELSFGLPLTADGAREHDEASVTEPAPLACGLRLRGSIDLVEQEVRPSRSEPTATGALAAVPDLPRLRATDYKTGRDYSRSGLRIGGGQTLQPALYALALESLFEGHPVTGGRLDFCTTRGSFKDREVQLTPEVRRDVATLVETLETYLGGGFLPAFPADEKACRYCDVKIACGGSEFERSQRKKMGAGVIQRLVKLRKRP